MKYKPWVLEPAQAWGVAVSDCDDVCIDRYHAFLQSEDGRRRIPDVVHELNNIGHYLHEHRDDYDDDTATEERFSEEWMHACCHNPLLPASPVPATTSDSIPSDWSEGRALLPDTLYSQCANWISTQRRLYQPSNITPLEDNSVCNDYTLNSDQRFAFDIIRHHRSNLLSADSYSPLFLMILGPAGTGKSFLIHAIVSFLGTACLVTATTGIAAFAVHGFTLHSTLLLPVRQQTMKDLQGSALARLQQRFLPIRYVLIEECSMLGGKTLCFVDRRLRQASGHLDKPFGGLSLILVGDFGQLPPVGDRPFVF